MNSETSRIKKLWCCLGIVALFLFSVTETFAQTTVQPGTTTVLQLSNSDDNCVVDSTVSSGITPVTKCIADASQPQPLRVMAVSGLSSDPNSFFGQTATSIGTLSQKIEIPVPTSGSYSDVLPVQIGTEITWSGGMVVAGLDSTFGQVVATLQVRDITFITSTDPGPIVASKTFLLERVDSDFEIIIPQSAFDFVDFLNLIEVADISNSSGADITALLARGRIYQIELEAKCDVQVPIFGFAACLFSSTALTDLGLPSSDLFTPIQDDAFVPTNFSVTVGSDVVQNVLTAAGL